LDSVVAGDLLVVCYDQNGAATKLGVPCVMHPHGYCRAYAGIEVCDGDRFQVVPAYIFNPKLSFSKILLQKQLFEKSFT
jgi:hypothetical protein